VRIEQELEIRRDPASVFAVLTDPDKVSAWQKNTVAVRRERQGFLEVGERFKEVHKALGREFPSTVEVAAFEAPRLFALRVVSGRVPLDGRWELERCPAGTRLRFIGEADVRGPMRLTKPMLAQQFRKHHRRLKELLERDQDANGG
jgi:uncharacterized protein YndB with AHSA1/START domain